MSTPANTAAPTRAQSLARIAMMSAVLAVLAQISIPIGAIPMTAQTLAVALAGYLLGARGGAVAALVYLALGCAGVPVFTAFRAGLSVVAGPTGGFLFAFPLASALCGLGARRGRGLPAQLLLGGAALASLYAVGTLWLCLSSGMGVWAALAAAVYPFVIKDVLSVAAAALIARAVKRRLRVFGAH